MEKIRVLVVDDSLFMRQAITKVISNDQIEVIDIAKNGKEAIEKAIELKPDIITMDIEMPVMNGLEAVREILKIQYFPILMLSTLTSEGANVTMEALSLGAIDFITKKSAFREIENLKEELIDKIITLSANSPFKNKLLRKKLLENMEKNKDDSEDYSHERIIQSTYPILKRNKPNTHEIKIMTIGISTGGPVALFDLLKTLPEDFPVPILIVQHMPPFFTKSLADRLDSICHINVKEAEDGDRLERGMCFVAPGGKQMGVNRRNQIVLSDLDPKRLFNPSANVLFESANEHFGKGVLALIMTGMGNDGTEGLKELSKNGAYIVAQDPETCVVSGMPKSAIDAKVVNEIVTLNNMPAFLCNLLGTKTSSAKLIKKEFVR